jgi:glycosyltransferase involved in cell wall biosynthesis
MTSEKIASFCAHRVLFISESLRLLALDEKLCSASKTKVLCNGSSGGVDAKERFNPTRYNRGKIIESLGISPQSIVIGYVGRIVCDKGIRELMCAWQKLKLKFPTLILLMIGPMEIKDSVSEEIKRKILDDPRVCYVNWVDDPAPYFAAMDIFAFPTYREGFGAVALQASSMRIPVVATNIPGCVDAVIDGVTGCLVTVGDAVALESALENYVIDPLLRRVHGCAGRNRALKDFNPKNIWKAQFEEYQELLKSKGLMN